jgi:hypothetical protein
LQSRSPSTGPTETFAVTMRRSFARAVLSPSL